MAVRVQVPPSAPYQGGTMTLSYCSLFSFCLSHPVKTGFYRAITSRHKLVYPDSTALEEGANFLYFAESTRSNQPRHMACF